MRRSGNVWKMKQTILIKFAAGMYKPHETLMVVTSTGSTTKTVLEWILEWFPTLKDLLK
ncbi:hypothetical protein LCGC14_0986360 [marine sediment metagenome]|uniref:Uncharacterized protein n=1 Tax=marine sediment metagenome TaxID=412755 RepID=A0A0F9NBN8_9ZZZZ